MCNGKEENQTRLNSSKKKSQFGLYVNSGCHKMSDSVQTCQPIALFLCLCQLVMSLKDLLQYFHI